MSLIHDLEEIERTVLATDPSFREIAREDLDHHIRDARQAALKNAKDEFLLSLMRLLALPRNGHTRLIPNTAISILPYRFVTIGHSVRLVGAPFDSGAAIGSELISINGIAVCEIEAISRNLLSGTRQRERVIGPILFVWPSALASLDVVSGSGTLKFRLRDATGQINRITPDTGKLVFASSLYPRNEHGKADAHWTPKTYLEVVDFGHLGLLMVLPSFFDLGDTDLSNAVSRAADRVRSRPDTPLIIDVRGNTGGDFLRTMPLIDAISEGANDRQVGVLVDKFTFSAAIVFVAILKHRLGARLRLIGEEMGDALTFFAEGGTVELSASGAVVRYSSAFHDWTEGRIDETTPQEIAKQIVAVGNLVVDHAWVANSDDIEARDHICKEMLDSLSR
ncbi:MAG: peptidase S41 [Marivita sp.]|uniref:peptidase S41 n=1 Tax=Marivita sp. TaxID=2003365 RepID=UPI003EFA0A00